MNTEIQKYIPQLEIELRDGRYFYIDLEQKQKFAETLRREKFIELEDEGININEIRFYRECKIPECAKFLNHEERKTLTLRSDAYRKNIGKQPSQSLLAKWSHSIKNGERVFV